MKNMNWKKAVSLLMAAVLVGSLTACSGGQGQKEASTELQKAEEKESAESTQAKGNEELPVLRVSLHPAYISTPVAYAIANDMAKDYGFQMEVQVYASGAPQNEALGSGLWDVGVIGGAIRKQRKYIWRICNRGFHRRTRWKCNICEKGF